MKRRGKSALLTLSGLFAAWSLIAPQGRPITSVVYGDSNGDGAVNIADATTTLKFAVNLLNPTPDQRAAADVAPYPGANGAVIGDGKMDISDAVRTLRFAVGLITETEFRPTGNSTVSFSNDVQPILENNCESFLCHGSRIPKGNLTMNPGEELSVLVNVESEEAPGVMRIKPGDPVHSYLLAKLKGLQESLGGSGERMPAGEALQPPPLPDSEIQTIEKWIAEGAPDN